MIPAQAGPVSGNPCPARTLKRTLTPATAWSAPRRSAAASSFSTLVWVNNAWVAARAIGMGVLGFPVVWVLWQNIANVAVIGSLMHRYDRADVFWGLLTPHGLLELMAVFVAAGVGLRLFTNQPPLTVCAVPRLGWLHHPVKY